MSLDIRATLPGNQKIKEYDKISSFLGSWSTKEMKDELTEDTNIVFEYNITHNLCDMAEQIPLLSLHLLSMPDEKCNAYYLLWRPDELWTEEMLFDKELTMQLLQDPLKETIDYMLTHHSELSKFNPKNGWGDFRSLMSCVTYYYIASLKWPKAIISTDR